LEFKKRHYNERAGEENKMEKNIILKRRRWWLAGLLSFLVPGLGQAYNGQVTKGLFLNFLLTTWSGLLFSLIYYIIKHPMPGFGLALLSLLFFTNLSAYLLIIIESIRTAWKADKEHALKPYNKWYIYLVTILVVLYISSSVALIVRENIIKAYKIPSGSMQPTLEPGDHIISNQLYYRYNDPGHGDIIIFKNPRDENQDFVKRIAGCPGDTIEIKDNQLFLNGKKSDEPYALYAKGEPSVNFGPFVVPENEYFVLGDNRNNAFDSRAFGTIKRHTIEGKVMFIYFSWDMNVPGWNLISRLLSIRISRIGEII
jgi:signal peptidase I